MIYTFYSYKGGVGRSMAMANLGACFFQKGLKVVMIDWDLEAPGLESYFYSDTNELSRVTSRRGLIDMFREYKEKYPGIAQQRMAAVAVEEPADNSQSDGDAESEAAEVEEITKQFLKKHARRIPERLRVPPAEVATLSPELTFGEVLDRNLTPVLQYLERIEASRDGGLWLLTAGARTRDNFGEYADAVQDFDWLEFLAKYQGKEYLEWLRDKLAWADVVLIDSRTGVTEMSGVCTRQMGDAVVSLCAPNSQNVDGVERIVASLGTDAARQARFRRQLQVLIVPTRIDDSESALAGKFAQDFDERLEIGNLPPELISDRFKGLQKPLWNLQVPYIPKFNYREQLVMGPKTAQPDPPTQKLIRAYENIAVHLAILAPGTNIWNVYASEIASQFPQFQRTKAPQMAPQLPDNWIERPRHSGELQERLLACAKAPNGGRVAVSGLAGIGKTMLAAKVCQTPEIQTAFPDGIVWLTLEGPWGKEQTQEFLRTSFGIPRQGGEVALLQALEEKKFLWVVDDVWASEQLHEIVLWGKRYTTLIITRDGAIAGEFSNTIVNIGYLSPEESAQLLKITPATQQLFDKNGLAWLLTWPLGASLIAAALERIAAEAGSAERSGDSLIMQIQKSGLKVLDRPATPGRNGSISLSLRESLGRLLPDERKLLMGIATGNVSLPDDDSPELRRLQQKGLIIRTSDGVLKVSEVFQRWLQGQGDFTEDAEATEKKKRTEALKRGYEITRGKSASLTEMQEVAYLAKDVRAFSLARKLFNQIRGSADAAALTETQKLKLVQQHALCTYKDDDLVADERFRSAFDILKEGDLHTPNPSQETLGLAGAIHKGRWRMNGQRSDLEFSLGYYRRGAAGSMETDFGYTRINAAFMLDVLAMQEEGNFATPAQARREEAARLREEIVVALPSFAAKTSFSWLKKEWWYGATMAEALFGLKRYSEARHWLREATLLAPAAWQLESTTRQLATLAVAQNVSATEDTEAWRTLAMLVGDSTEAVRAITAGKTGLALSGGGFRASLFHIGVLARLAEFDLLRHVEVLSCVSGGSIIGAHYYLEVRRLLQEKRDREITRQDYIDVVKRLERDFLAGVQKNLRCRLFAGWIANWKTLVLPGYTRTNYLGELLERHIYSLVDDGEKGPRWLESLRIFPKDAGQDFNPKLDNWRRAAKVPILLLNATTLNTGHVWQFTVSWMGEPPQSTTSSVDSNDLLRRMYYSDAPVKHRRVRLGDAVAASACVPALFDPIELSGLFPRRKLRLVDGGVHDNQGTAGLLEQECTVVLVSDASGQMNSQRRPSGNMPQVLMRSNSISMARVRESEFRELNTLRRSSALAGLMFLHLKKDLDITFVDWVDCQDPYEAFANAKNRTGKVLTGYGVPKSVQELLAGLRTDLDTFSDAEAYALMLSGYRMTNTEFRNGLPRFPVPDMPRESWRFLGVEPTVDRATDFEPEHDALRRVLSVGGGQAFKPFRLRLFAASASLILVLSAFAVGLWKLFTFAEPALVSGIAEKLGWTVAILGSILVLLAIAQRRTVSVLITGTLIVTIGWLAARIYLWLLDPIYKRAGAVKLRSGTSSSEPR